MNNPSIYIVEENVKEIITKVKECKVTYNSVNYMGIRIITNKQIMNFLIEDYCSCSEEFDVVLHNSNFDDLINDDLINDLINDELVLVKWADEDDINNISLINDNMQTAIIHLETNNRKVFVVIYNDHNGYYPHSYKVNWGDYSDTDEL